MPAPAPPPDGDDAVSLRARTAIAAALAAIEGHPAAATDRAGRRATAVIHAIQAHRRGSGEA